MAVKLSTFSVEIEKSGGKKALDDLKKDIGGMTLVGEYVGSDEH